MKKILLGLLAGLALGAVVTAWLLQRSTRVSPTATESTEHPAGAPAESPLHLSPDRQAKAGIVISMPTMVEIPTELKAYGRVLDPTPLVALLAELEGAQATLTASQAEFGRLEKLHAENNNASTQALEASEAALKRDRALAMSARARLLAGWGPALATRPDLRALVQSLVAQKAALARLDAPSAEAAARPPTVARISPLAGNNSAPRAAEVLGPAPTADSQVQGAAYFALLREQPLPAGTAVVGFLAQDGPGQKTVTVPRSAIVYHEGSAWVFVLGEKDAFQRRRIEIGQALTESCAVTSGISEKDRIVTVGAQQLLSSELQAAAGGE